jgi:molybdopterin synthase catalytic subunit
MAKGIKNIFVEEAISPAFIADSITKHSTNLQIGGHSIFLGQVRADEKEGQTVTAIHYSAYTDMALQTAHRIREDVFAEYDLTCMHIYHSLGRVNVGEICLFVFTSSKHRKAAIQACDTLVERIKNELPVWGEEIMISGTSQWKVNT